MKSDPDRSLKAQNFKWHVALATTHVIVIALFVAPELVTDDGITRLGIYRLLAAVVLPIVVLLLVNTLPSNTKAMLVYWKPQGVLPGSQAFTKWGPNDPRVNMEQLRKNVGALPTDPREQNSRWFKLYKLVEKEPSVVGAQKDFLMYRDMAALTLPLVVIVPIALWFVDLAPAKILGAAAWFAIVYVLCAHSGKNAGERFVQNVLALHSAKKITGSRANTPSA